MNLGKIFKNLALPTALVASVGACSTSNYDQREGAALGGALGGVLAGAAADALGVDSRTRRSIERAGTLAGAAQGKPEMVGRRGHHSQAQELPQGGHDRGVRSG